MSKTSSLFWCWMVRSMEVWRVERRYQTIFWHELGNSRKKKMRKITWKKESMSRDFLIFTVTEIRLIIIIKHKKVEVVFFFLERYKLSRDWSLHVKIWRLVRVSKSMKMTTSWKYGWTLLLLWSTLNQKAGKFSNWEDVKERFFNRSNHRITLNLNHRGMGIRKRKGPGTSRKCEKRKSSSESAEKSGGEK